MKIFAAAESDARSHKSGDPFNLPLAVLCVNVTAVRAILPVVWPVSLLSAGRPKINRCRKTSSKQRGRVSYKNSPNSPSTRTPATASFILLFYSSSLLPFFFRLPCSALPRKQNPASQDVAATDVDPSAPQRDGIKSKSR